MRKKTPDEPKVKFNRRTAVTYRRITATLPDDFYQAVHQYALDNQLTVSALIEKSLRRIVK